MKVYNDAMYERLASLPIIHVLLKGSTVWPQSKQLGRQSVFPQGILRTEVLRVVLLPKELTHFKQRGQVLFATIEEEMLVCYPNHETTHTYFPPWILFGFLKPENRLTLPIKEYDRLHETYKQSSFL